MKDSNLPKYVPPEENQKYAQDETKKQREICTENFLQIIEKISQNISRQDNL